MLSTDFNGSWEYIGATNPINTLDTEGHDSFTIQAWFLAQSTDGYRTLLSNTENFRGVSLKIKDGQLRGLIRIENGGSHFNVEILGGDIQPDQWHYAAFRVKDQDNTYRLELFLDGELVASVVSNHFEGIRQSSEAPMVGAEPNGGVGGGGFFDGYIYAVSITNYAVGKANFLKNKGFRDASRYFGMASYHDYLDTTDGPDHRISRTIDAYGDIGALVTGRWYTPFMNDRYVPQGVASNNRDRIYLSMYWRKTVDDSVRPASIVAEVATSGQLRRLFQLRNFSAGDCNEGVSEFSGHVGGAAFWQDYLYVPWAGDAVYRYRIPDSGTAIFDPETFDNAQFDDKQICADARYEGFSSVCTGNDTASYLSISENTTGVPILWVGRFHDRIFKEIGGYEIDPATGDVDPADPIACFKLTHYKVQGVFNYYLSPTHAGFYVATSYGDNPSVIYDVMYSRSSGLPVYDETVFTGPAGIEDLTMIGNELWTVSESGAKYYQKVRLWDDMFPFVFKINTNSFPAPASVTQTPIHNSNVEIQQVSPNPFNPRIVMLFETGQADMVRAEILNLTGEVVVTLLGTTLPKGHHEVTWNGLDREGRAMASGVYFFRVTTSRDQANKKITLVR